MCISTTTLKNMEEVVFIKGEPQWLPDSGESSNLESSLRLPSMVKLEPDHVYSEPSAEKETSIVVKEEFMDQNDRLEVQDVRGNLKGNVRDRSKSSLPKNSGKLCEIVDLTEESTGEIVKKHGQEGKIEASMVLSSGERPNMCKLCGERFIYKWQLVLHLSNHATAKRYRCDTCKRDFQNESSLNRHALVHTNFKPFSCEECKKSFKRRSSLRAHKVVHSGSKNFICDVCGKLFHRKVNLENHMSRHNKT